MDLTQLARGIDDESANEEWQTCKHFVVDSEMENGRYRVSNFAMEIMDEHTSSQNLNTVFEKFFFFGKVEGCIWLCAP